MLAQRLSAALVAACVIGAPLGAAGQLRLPSLQGELIDPLARPPSAKAVVVLFLSVGCPISNRYAPELRRLHDRYSPQGVVFRLVFPNPAESIEAIRQHLAEYGYQGLALQDPRHELVARVGATVTPEAAVYDTADRLVYRGRIDDLYVHIGLQRPKATSPDLERTLTAVLAGKEVLPGTTPAVGCFIADFLR
jgi:hypothetical protein